MKKNNARLYAILAGLLFLWFLYLDVRVLPSYMGGYIISRGIEVLADLLLVVGLLLPKKGKLVRAGFLCLFFSSAYIFVFDLFHGLRNVSIIMRNAVYILALYTCVRYVAAWVKEPEGSKAEKFRKNWWRPVLYMTLYYVAGHVGDYIVYGMIGSVGAILRGAVPTILAYAFAMLAMAKESITVSAKSWESEIDDSYDPFADAAVQPVQPPVDDVNVVDELRKYKNLLDQGSITQEEYDAKRDWLLGL